MNNYAKKINTLGRFCGPRDIACLTQSALLEKYGIAKADLLVLFGGSILAGGDVLAQAMKNQVAETYMIVGGEGHTTASLRKMAGSVIPGLHTEKMAEAEIFNAYIQHRYGLQADLLETRSTNCGNNITNMLEILDDRHIFCENIILIQDSTMQRRMAATLEKYRPHIRAIPYAANQPEVLEMDGKLVFREEIPGMWKMDRYVSLLLGEIRRLTDDAQGYGPAGKGFIAHVDIPKPVREAFLDLSKVYDVRQANPLYS